MARKLPLKRIVGKINGGKAYYFMKFKVVLPKIRCAHCFRDMIFGETIYSTTDKTGKRGMYDGFWMPTCEECFKKLPIYRGCE